MHRYRISIDMNRKYGRIQPIEVVGHRVRCVCDCGAEFFCTKSNLDSGVTKSCGCYRRDVFIKNNVEGQSERTKKYWEHGVYSKEFARELALSNVEKHKGEPAKGLSAKGPENAHAKYYEVIRSDGVLLSGLNLSHLIRENEHLFLPEDVKWEKNQYGTDRYCRAMIGLRSLFRSKRPSKSWKGWRKIHGPND